MTWVRNLKSNLKGLNFQGGAQLFLKTTTAKEEAEFTILASSASSELGSIEFQGCFHLPFNFLWKFQIQFLGSHVSHLLCKTLQGRSEVIWLTRTSLTPVLSCSFPSLPFLYCLHSQAIWQGHKLKVWSWGYLVLWVIFV